MHLFVKAQWDDEGYGRDLPVYFLVLHVPDCVCFQYERAGTFGHDWVYGLLSPMISDKYGFHLVSLDVIDDTRQEPGSEWKPEEDPAVKDNRTVILFAPDDTELRVKHYPPREMA